ncbi:formate--tetrahydrofolate ligase, partial [uncultured Campylobacter sp.]|uniref:formate--tetrahydrofolate ligase n=1 Tax=uncultured Campylobacter sp. TaxID=218934 RepID=UPI0026099A2F
DEEIAHVRALCEESGAEFSVCEGFLKGSVGTEDLAKKVAQICEKQAHEINFTYEPADPVKTKIEKIATKIYGAKEVVFSPRAQEDLVEISRLGFDGLPVCVAKTQYSFSSDAKLLGRPKGFSFEVSALEIRGGAGFIVAVSGSTMLMPGLPKVPAAEQMKAE